MSVVNFNPQDRADLTSGGEAGPTRVRLMARSGGYVMVRKPGAVPFCLTEKQWARLPLYTAEMLDAARAYREALRS